MTPKTAKYLLSSDFEQIPIIYLADIYIENPRSNTEITLNSSPCSGNTAKEPAIPKMLKSHAPQTGHPLAKREKTAPEALDTPDPAEEVFLFLSK